MRNLKLILIFKALVLFSALTSLVSSCLSEPISEQDRQKTRPHIVTDTTEAKKDTIPEIHITNEESETVEPDSIVIVIYPTSVNITSAEYSAVRSCIPKNVSITLDDFSIKGFRVNSENLFSETSRQNTYKYYDNNTLIIQPNNSFYAIAKDFRINTATLRRYNPHIKNIHVLPIGEYLYLSDEYCKCN